MPRSWMLALLCWSGTAHATKVSVKVHPCPIGTGTVKIYESIAANKLGGFDSDLAHFSRGGQFRAWAISTCPENLLSAYGEDMRRPWTADERATAATLLPSLATMAQHPGEPTITERYRMAAELYKAWGADPFDIADVYIQASWVARDDAVGEVMGIQGPAGVLEALEMGAGELAKDLPTATRKVLRFNLARIAHRGGLGEARDEHLAAFVALGELDAAEQSALAAFHEAAGQTEPALQHLAIEQLKLGLRRPGLEMQDKIRATYLLADLLRRTGHPEDAFPLYVLVADEGQAPDDLRTLSTLLGKMLIDSGKITLSR